MFEYKCKVLKVVDGDTVDVDIDLGFGVWLRDERVRVAGIDSPESRTRDLVEKEFGLAAKAYLIRCLAGKDVQLVCKSYDSKGKFGRILGDFRTPELVSVAQSMIDEKHAVAYSGQSKDDVEEQHLANRAFLIENGTVRLDDEE